MSQSLAQIYLHLVFSTKGRIAFLEDREILQRVHGYIAEVCKRLDTDCLIIGGMPDHIHILCVLGKSIAPADLTGC